MYNTEQKEKFITEYTERESVRRVCATTFNATEEYEKAWCADLCTRSAAELEPIVATLLGLRSKSMELRMTILREYVKWCITNQVPEACDGMLHVEIDGLEKMKHQTVKNPRHLQAYLDSICDKESDETTDNTLRCYYWMAYAGMKEEDIIRVTADNVDLSYMVIRFGGYEYPIYREALPCIKNCMTLTRFLYEHPNYGADKTVYRDRAEGSALVRGIRAAPSVVSMRAMISRRSRECTTPDDNGNVKTDMHLSYYRVWISGFFYRVYEGELAGITDTAEAFLTVVKDMKKDKTYKLASGRNTQSAKHRKLAWEYQKDYERWKMTLVP